MDIIQHKFWYAKNTQMWRTDCPGANSFHHLPSLFSSSRVLEGDNIPISVLSILIFELTYSWSFRIWKQLHKQIIDIEEISKSSGYTTQNQTEAATSKTKNKNFQVYILPNYPGLESRECQRFLAQKNWLQPEIWSIESVPIFFRGGNPIYTLLLSSFIR